MTINSAQFHLLSPCISQLKICYFCCIFCLEENIQNKTGRKKPGHSHHKVYRVLGRLFLICETSFLLSISYMQIICFDQTHPLFQFVLCSQTFPFLCSICCCCCCFVYLFLKNSLSPTNVPKHMHGIRLSTGVTSLNKTNTPSLSNHQLP